MSAFIVSPRHISTIVAWVIKQAIFKLDGYEAAHWGIE